MDLSQALDMDEASAFADAILIEWVVRYGVVDITYGQYETMRRSHPIDVYLSAAPWLYIGIDRTGFPHDAAANALRRTWLTEKGLARLKELMDGDKT